MMHVDTDPDTQVRHFNINERSNGKTDITFELRTVENLRSSIKGKMALFTCTVLSTLLFTILFT